MIKLILIFVLLIFLVIALDVLKKKENFQLQNNNIQVLLDKSDILPNFEDDNLAEIHDINNYKNVEMENKIIKMLEFKQSAFRLKNLDNLNEYTLYFNIEFKNQSIYQVLVNSVDTNDNLVYEVYLFNGSLFIKFYNKSHKFSEQIELNKNYAIVLNVSKNSLTCFFNSDIKTLTTPNNRSTNNNITFGSIYKNNKIINPLDGFIGNINLYNEIIEPKKLLGLMGDNSAKLLEKKIEICKFIPQGATLSLCKEKCKKDNTCNPEYCDKICEKCIDYNNCKWLQAPKSEPQASMPDPDVPMPPKIHCYSGDGYIEVRFKKPFDNHSPINKYLIQTKKSYKNDGITKLVSFEANDCGKGSCRFQLKGLDNQDYYNINVRSLNAIGMSINSNSVTIAPDGEIESKNISDALIETDDEIKKQLYKDFNYDDSFCDAGSFVNYDEHILDSVDKYSIDDFIKEAYLKK